MPATPPSFSVTRPTPCPSGRIPPIPPARITPWRLMSASPPTRPLFMSASALSTSPSPRDRSSRTTIPSLSRSLITSARRSSTHLRRRRISSTRTAARACLLSVRLSPSHSDLLDRGANMYATLSPQRSLRDHHGCRNRPEVDRLCAQERRPQRCGGQVQVRRWQKRGDLPRRRGLPRRFDGGRY